MSYIEKVEPSIRIFGTPEQVDKAYKDYVKIGVNDIERYLLPDYIVIVDKLLRFTSERQEYIINGKCKDVFVFG